MERLKDARTIAAKRGVRSAAVTTDRRLITAAIVLLDSGGEGAVFVSNLLATSTK